MHFIKNNKKNHVISFTSIEKYCQVLPKQEEKLTKELLDTHIVNYISIVNLNSISCTKHNKFSIYAPV